MYKKNILSKDKGVAIILIVGILAVLVIIGITFVMVSHLEFLVAKNSLLETKATYLAECGVNKAIAGIINDTKLEYIDELNDAWCSKELDEDFQAENVAFSDNSLLGNKGEYKVEVVDCQRMVNINNANQNLLENLPNIGSTLALGIINARPFETKEEIRRVSGISETIYNNLKDYITVNSWEDPACSYRSPINVNTAPKKVLEAVLTGLCSDPASVADDIINKRQTNPFDGWGEFNDFIANLDGDPDINSEEETIINNCNPNRDKTGLSSPTTEFCFHSGGYYEILSKGLVYKTTSQKEVVSEKIVNCIVHTHNIINKTTKEDFRGEDANYNGTLDAGEDIDGDGSLDVPTYERVNWLDSCPVNSNDDQGLNYASDYEKIPGSIKLGFWDNFDEDNDNDAKEGWSWKNWQNEEELDYPMGISDINSDGDNELWGSGWHCWAKFRLRDSKGWVFDDEFSLRVNIDNCTTADGQEDAAMVEFHGSSGLNPKAKLMISTWGFLYNPGRIDITRPPSCQWWDPTVASDPLAPECGEPREGKDFFDSQLRFHLWDGKVVDRLYNIGNILYGISVCTNDHYNNWQADEGVDDYHGVTPDKETLKLVVSSDYSPNYRVYAAVGYGWHHHYNYWNGWHIDAVGYDPITTGYVNIPVHTTTQSSFDRYGYWDGRNTGSNSWNTTNWYLVLYQNKAQGWWDEIRLICPSGFYESPWYGISDSQRWGTVSWTETIPSSANASSETISVQIDTGSGFTSISNGGSIGTTSDRFRYRVDLASEDDDYSETPVFEDITVTYLIPTQIIYWREN